MAGLCVANDHGRINVLASFHRAAGDENNGNVEAHRSNQHAGRDLVTVGDADHGVRTVGIHHVFNGVGDDFATG